MRWWNNIKHTNISIIGIPKGKEREKRTENLSDEIKAENFPNQGKETDIQAQGVQRVPNKLNPKISMPKHIINKMTKVKVDKEGILKAMRDKQLVTYKKTPIRLSVDFSEDLQARREWQDIFKVLKEKSYNLQYSTQKDYHSELKER